MLSTRKYLVPMLALATVFVTACGGAAKNTDQTSKTAAPAASQSTSGIVLPDRIKSAGKIVIAMDTTYAPMEFIGDDGKSFQGYDVDLANAMGQKMGIKVEFQTVNWDGIISGLTSKRYDAIMSAMNITPERQAQIDFVQYAEMAQVFVTRKDKAPMKTEKDLAGRVLAVQSDTTSEDFINGLPKDQQPKDLHKFVDNNAVYMDINSGRAEGAVTDEPVGRYYVQKYASTMAVTGTAMKPEPIGIGIRKDDTQLKDAFQKAYDAIKADGTYDQISKKWFGGELGK